MSKKHVLVTGGAGFIGSHLCEELIQQNYQVTCIDNFSTGHRSNISHLPSLEVIEADVNEKATWRALATRNFDVVFHYAATVGVRLTEEQPHLVMADIQGLLHLAAFVKEGHARKVIFASSSEVYGNATKIPMEEASAPLAWSPYTTVKAMGEHLMRTLWTTHHIPTASLRFFNVYGPRQNGNNYGFVIGIFIRQILADTPPTVFGDGQQTRDFVYIKDNVAASVAVSEHPHCQGQVINIGTGKETTILDLANLLISCAQKNEELQPKFVLGRPTEIGRRCASVATMHTILGMTCTTPLEQGVLKLLQEEAENQSTTKIISNVFTPQHDAYPII